MISISHVSHKLVQESHFFNKLTASSTLQTVVLTIFNVTSVA